MDLARAVLAHPERALGPREARVAAVAGRRDGPEHAAGLRIDLLDAALGDLIEVPAVERGARVRGHVDRSCDLAARWFERIEPVARGEPHVLAVERYAVDFVDTRKGTVLAENFGRTFHALMLVGRQRARE